MKSVIFTILVILFTLMFFFYRRRLKLAFMVAGGLYVGLILIRFVLYAQGDEGERFTDLALILGGLGAVWLVTNVITRLMQRHRQRRARR